jgi:integrase
VADAPALEAVPGGFRVLLRVGSGQRLRVVIPITDQRAATRRAEQLQSMARSLVKAKQTAKARLILTQAAEQTAEAGFRSIAKVVDGLCAASGKLAPERKTALTFRKLGESWTSGELHKLYPDQVPLKATAADDASRLDRYAYPVIGAKPVDEVKLEDCEQIMRRIPDSASRSRRHIASTIARVFQMAVYPCRYITASPLPRGFLPRANSRKALTYLYPANDRALLACAAVPFGYRLLWGFLAREGMREGEALALTWGDVDLVRGMIKLDQNKTDDPRAWALDPGVARALRVYHAHFAPEADAAEPVFIQRSKFGLAETFRTHLERAGVKAERPELFVRNASRQPIRVHDLRGTFVTLSLANGRPESWVMARTGHRSSAMMNRYRRIATSFTELNLGELAPLDVALPELAQLALLGKVGLQVGHINSETGGNAMYSMQKPAASPTGFEPVLQP